MTEGNNTLTYIVCLSNTLSLMTVKINHTHNVQKQMKVVLHEWDCIIDSLSIVPQHFIENYTTRVQKQFRMYNKLHGAVDCLLELMEQTLLSINEYYSNATNENEKRMFTSIVQWKILLQLFIDKLLLSEPSSTEHFFKERHCKEKPTRGQPMETHPSEEQPPTEKFTLKESVESAPVKSTMDDFVFEYTEEDSRQGLPAKQDSSSVVKVESKKNESTSTPSQTPLREDSKFTVPTLKEDIFDR